VISGGIEYAIGGTAYATVIAGSGTLSLEAGSSAQGGITFTGIGGELIVEAPFFSATATTPTTPISGFGATDKIDLQGVAYTSTVTVASATPLRRGPPAARIRAQAESAVRNGDYIGWAPRIHGWR
jgi:hypothetical protein